MNQRSIHLLKSVAMSLLGIACLLYQSVGAAPARADQDQSPLKSDDPSRPSSVVKLIFIHHSTGGNWLADPSQNELGGGLGHALMENNYYVSATNYSWGPDSIGDATDIPNWLDWFRSSNSPTYLEALYNENGQNFGDFGSWPRLADDPGGENDIIVFKSCFPNSDLEGRPDDPPDPEGWLSVGHAKYVYNEILQYFASRPDKLFIVITAPPLSSSANAKNARAFNNWLVDAWLAENNYTQNNVAVFDFYNILTSPDAHHRFNNGQIEHITANRNTLYYPSGDDHPSAAGNRKATEEFLPLLNIYYNRWAATAPDAPPDSPTPASGNEQPTAIPPAPSGTSSLPGTKGLLADFDTLTPSLEAYNDEGGVTTMTCTVSADQAHGGAQSLRLDFNIAANGWATCAHFYDGPQNWNGGQGLSFYLRSASAGPIVHIDLYAGPDGQRETYYYTLELPPDSVNGWIPIELRWEDFHRSIWEENANAPFAKPDQVTGFAFGFPTYQDVPNTGTIWIDDVSLLGTNLVVEPTTMPVAETGRGNPLCPASVALPLGFAALAWVLRRK
jgi:hypothetical protein